MKTGFSIRTWKKRLTCQEPDLLVLTEKIYKEISYIYYSLLLDHSEIWNLGMTDIQRELEKLTIPGRDGRKPEYPLPYDRTPVYIRRSAINKAITIATTSLSQGESDDSSYISDAQENDQFPSDFDPHVTFFKGSYRNLTDESVELKLYDGEQWIWVDCELSGRAFPKDAVCMSPTMVLEEKRWALHIPVKAENSDARSAKERMQSGEKICSIRFTNTDIFALCTVLDEYDHECGVYSCKGGDAYRHHCSQLLKRIEKSRVFTDRDNTEQPNKKYYMHLKNLSEHYAHRVSREIVSFCQEKGASVIALPKYEENYSHMVLHQCGNFSPLGLSLRIRRLLAYKAWAAGIIVLDVKADDLANTCAVCGATIRKKEKQYICENGHQGSRYLNDARLLGKKCRESFRKNAEKVRRLE